MNNYHHENICSTKNLYCLTVIHDHTTSIKSVWPNDLDASWALLVVIEIHHLKGHNETHVGCLHHQLWKQHDQIDGGKEASITV